MVHLQLCENTGVMPVSKQYSNCSTFLSLGQSLPSRLLLLLLLFPLPFRSHQPPTSTNPRSSLLIIIILLVLHGVVVTSASVGGSTLGDGSGGGGRQENSQEGWPSRFHDFDFLSRAENMPVTMEEVGNYHYSSQIESMPVPLPASNREGQTFPFRRNQRNGARKRGINTRLQETHSRSGALQRGERHRTSGRQILVEHAMPNAFSYQRQADDDVSTGLQAVAHLKIPHTNNDNRQNIQRGSNARLSGEQDRFPPHLTSNSSRLDGGEGGVRDSSRDEQNTLIRPSVAPSTDSIHLVHQLSAKSGRLPTKTPTDKLAAVRSQSDTRIYHRPSSTPTIALSARELQQLMRRIGISNSSKTSQEQTLQRAVLEWLVNTSGQDAETNSVLTRLHEASDESAEKVPLPAPLRHAFADAGGALAEAAAVAPRATLGDDKLEPFVEAPTPGRKLRDLLSDLGKHFQRHRGRGRGSRSSSYIRLLRGRWLLALNASGRVYVTKDVNDANTVFRRHGIDNSLLALQGQEARKFLTFSKRGQLTASRRLNRRGHFIGLYADDQHSMSLLSQYRSNDMWYVGVTDSGDLTSYNKKKSKRKTKQAKSMPTEANPTTIDDDPGITSSTEEYSRTVGSDVELPTASATTRSSRNHRKKHSRRKQNKKTQKKRRGGSRTCRSQKCTCMRRNHLARWCQFQVVTLTEDAHGHWL